MSMPGIAIISAMPRPGIAEAGTSIGAHVEAQTASANDAEKERSASSAARIRKRRFTDLKIALAGEWLKSGKSRPAPCGSAVVARGLPRHRRGRTGLEQRSIR